MRRRFKHYFTGRTVNLTEKQVQDLAKRASEGDVSAAKQLVEGHILVAFKVVAGFTGDQDELMSDAVFGLVDAVRLISEGNLKHYDNVSGYIKTRINGYLLNCLVARKSIVYRPANTVMADILSDMKLKDVETAFDTSMEVEEQIEHLAKDAIDAKIIRMLMLGHGAKEIAASVELEQCNVHRRIVRIRLAYKEAMT